MPKKIYDEAVFQVVVDTLVERGYAGATTKHIAEIAGISEVSLFRKYGSKAELVLTAVRGHIFNPTANDALYTGDVFADLLRLVTLYDKAPEHNASLFPLLVSEMSRYPELQELQFSAAESILAVTDMIERYQAERVLRELPPANVISTLLGPIMLNRLLQNIMQHLDISPIDLEVHVRRFLVGHAHPVFAEQYSNNR